MAIATKTIKQIDAALQRQKRKAMKEFKNREKTVNELFKINSARVLRDIKKIQVKSPVKIKTGLFNNLPDGIKKQLSRLTDYLNDRNDNRIWRTLGKDTTMFKNLRVVYAVKRNGEIMGWANYWKSREGFKFDFDEYVYIHVKKCYRKNKIGQRLFKRVYKDFLKGKKNQRRFFMPKMQEETRNFKNLDWFDKMLKLAKTKKI